MKVPFVNFKRMHNFHYSVREEIDKVITKVIDKGAFVGGPFVEEFEENFAKYIGTKYAVGVSSGTSALEIVLRALGIGQGDEVILPANTFIATAFAVSAVGAEVVLCDVGTDSYTIAVDQIKGLITKKTKAIIPVHLYGNMANILGLRYLMESLGFPDIPIIEDCAQSIGASFFGNKAGSIFDAGCFSFYPAKNLGSFGEGGIITTNNSVIADFARAYRDQGQCRKYYHDLIGHNHRLHALQAAILNVKLNYIDEWNMSRIKAAEFYNILFAEWDSFELPKPMLSNKSHVYHLYELGVYDREVLMEHLDIKGIGYGLHYPLPIHKQNAYNKRKIKGTFPITDGLCRSLISLPIFPYIEEKEIKYVASTIKDFYAKMH